MSRLTKDSQRLVDSVSSALEELEDTNLRLDNHITTLENKLEEAEINADKLMSDIAELNEYIQELETALAEAYLTSSDDAPEEDKADPVV